MLLYIDSANPKHIEEISEWGCVSGITTNPKILDESGQTKKYIETLEEIIDVADRHNIPHVSIELISEHNYDELISEAKKYSELGDMVVIKVPMYQDGLGLRVINKLYQEEIRTNATCLMNYVQVQLAALSGADYVSLFYNRMKDFYWDSGKARALVNIENSAKLLKDLDKIYETVPKLICGSIRDPQDVEDCSVYGADIVTVPYDIFKQLPLHEKTQQAIEEFDKRWKSYKSKLV